MSLVLFGVALAIGSCMSKFDSHPYPVIPVDNISVLLGQGVIPVRVVLGDNL